MKLFNILGVDLGSNLGLAENTVTENGDIVSVTTKGVELCDADFLKKAQKTGADRDLDPRAKYFSLLLEEIHAWPDLVVFEDVQFGRSVAQVQLWSSFRGVLWSFAARHNIRIVGVHVKSLKKWTTGNGNADKPAMKKAALRRWPTLAKRPQNDDEIDALALAMWGAEYFKRFKLSLGE